MPVTQRVSEGFCIQKRGYLKGRIARLGRNWWERHKVLAMEVKLKNGSTDKVMSCKLCVPWSFELCCARSVDGGITRILMLPLEAAASK